MKGMVFKQFTLEPGIIFQETNQLVEDFIKTRDYGIRFCFG